MTGLPFDPLDALLVVAVLLGSYLVGSIPLSPLVGRAAGVDVLRHGERNPGSANVWNLAGPGWGLLALAGDLSKGALPVAIATATWSWGEGWLAGLGAIVGHSWPFFGRGAGGRGVATFAGAALMLAPLAGLVGLALTGGVVVSARLLRRNGRVAAIAAGIGAYPLLFMLVHQDVQRLLALLVLYLVTVLRYVTTRGPGAAPTAPESGGQRQQRPRDA
jgi:acyl phosphate:glycerol-3-phosphate acyltransferase